jgi:uncharacterized hydrophobic protein (TIGR00271 family)
MPGMAMVHLRVVSPPAMVDDVLDVLTDRVGVIAVAQPHDSTNGPVVLADLARECADAVLADLHGIGLPDDGMITLYPVPTAMGGLVERAEDEAPGAGDDALVWDELSQRLEDDSTLTWTFLAFMVLATMLAAIGVITDSTVTVVGAMVVGPEFGPLAGVAIGLVRRRHDIARRAVIALVVGFVTAIVVVTLLSLAARGGGLLDAATLRGRRQTDFIYHPGWFSLITALVAGAAGMLSLTSSRATALVGVFISVTTVPAAGNAAAAGAVGDWHEAALSAAQLGINLVGISLAAAAVLAVRRRAVPHPVPSVRARGA